MVDEEPLYNFWKLRNQLSVAWIEYHNACGTGSKEAIESKRKEVYGLMEEYGQYCTEHHSLVVSAILGT